MLLCLGCKSEPPIVDYSHIPEAFTITIQHPAGTSLNHSFLPLPGNLGQLSTSTKVLVIAEQVAIDTKISVRPIATLFLEENGNPKQVIIASPLDTLLQLSSTTNFNDFITKNVGEKQIIQDWFLYEKGLGKTTLIGWENEKVALEIVRKQGKS